MNNNLSELEIDVCLIDIFKTRSENAYLNAIVIGLLMVAKTTASIFGVQGFRFLQ